MTILTEQHLSQWSAWIEDRPEVAFGGNTPGTAASRLVMFQGFDPGPSDEGNATS